MTRIDLPDGTYLDRIGDAPDVGIDSDSGRTARWEAATSRLLDSEGNVIREVRKAQQRATTKPRKPSRGNPGDTSRFATMNAFVDHTMRHLSPVEYGVWLKLYRDTRDGEATASNRDLAYHTGCSLRAVTAAVKLLRSVGLIQATRLSHHKGEPSKYAINPHPDRCVDAIVSMKAPRTGATDAPVAT